MQFFDITEEMKTSPGEYIYHEPTKQIVLCGSFNRDIDTIKAMARGKLFSDKIENFKKIRINKEERRKRKIPRCKKCGK